MKYFSFFQPPFVVYNYMDNLPTFSDLTQNKQEQTVKKKEDIKLSPSLLTKSTSAVKEIQVKEVSTNLETKSKQEPKSPIPETKQEAKSPIPETKQEAKSTTPETKQEPMTIITPPGNKQKIKLESKQQMKVTIEKETDGKWMYCKVKGCHFWTRKQIRMDRHEKSHVPGDDKFYQCPECQLKICSLSKLLRHDRKFHTGFKDYECKICEAEVTDIAVHMRVSNAFFYTHTQLFIELKKKVFSAK